MYLDPPRPVLLHKSSAFLDPSLLQSHVRVKPVLSRLGCIEKRDIRLDLFHLLDKIQRDVRYDLDSESIASSLQHANSTYCGVIIAMQNPRGWNSHIRIQSLEREKLCRTSQEIQVLAVSDGGHNKGHQPRWKG